MSLSGVLAIIVGILLLVLIALFMMLFLVEEKMKKSTPMDYSYNFHEHQNYWEADSR